MYTWKFEFWHILNFKNSQEAKFKSQGKFTPLGYVHVVSILFILHYDDKHVKYDNNCWFISSKGVWDNLCRIVAVITSLRLFVTACKSQTLYDCLIAKPGWRSSCGKLQYHVTPCWHLGDKLQHQAVPWDPISQVSCGHCCLLSRIKLQLLRYSLSKLSCCVQAVLVAILSEISNAACVHTKPFWMSQIPIGRVNEYPTMHYFGLPRHTQSVIAYMICTEYLWKFQWKLHCGNAVNMPC